MGGQDPAGDPDRESPADGRRGWGTGLAVAALLLAAWFGGDGGAPPAAPGSSGYTELSATGPPLPPGDPMERAVPTRVQVPAIGVDASVTTLGLDAGGRLSTPPGHDDNLAGWYGGGAAPGESGNALLVGHVDTATGPAVFQRIGTLGEGHRIEVERADGSRALFSVDSVETHAKDAFPDRKVYGDTARPELRLITCGGSFSRESGGYQANVVVYAHLVRPR